MDKIKQVGFKVEKHLKVGSLVLADILLSNAAFLLALYVHHEGAIQQELLLAYKYVWIVVTLIRLVVYNAFKLYDSLWEYASIEELIKVVAAVIVANVAAITFMKYMRFNVYAGIYIIAMTLEVALIGGLRFSYRFMRRIKNQRTRLFSKDHKHILIIGSGSTASLIASEIKNHPQLYGHVIGFIDDDEHKQGKVIAGLKVLGNRYDIYSVVKRFHVDEIIIAIPSQSINDRKEIFNECQKTDAKLKIIPGIVDIIDGRVSMNHIRDVEIEDLLGRPPVQLNIHKIASYIEDKVVMITGGGGSIGSELCRQIARFNPSKIIVVDIYENNAYAIENELSRTYKNAFELEVIIASVRDRKTIYDIVKEHSPYIIFHAAAHKHVPLMERSPKEAIKNNVFGTLNVAEVAHELGVEHFVLISTDKAVNPTNVMGASKRLCEMVVQGLSKHSTTKFAAVRFGNVLGSNGSVIPLFKQQIKEGGPVTVTHREITRFFMTIPEAAQLVVQAGAIANGGEVFVLDMGESVKIYELAEELIRLSGLKPHEDIAIQITGLRPGEKLYEELLMDEEGLTKTDCNKIFIGQQSEIDYLSLKKALKEFEKIILTGDDEDVLSYLKYLVPTYKNNKVVNRAKEEMVRTLHLVNQNMGITS